MHSPNVISVGDTAEVNSWDADRQEYRWKRVRINGFKGGWCKFTFVDDGESGSQMIQNVRRSKPSNGCRCVECRCR